VSTFTVYFQATIEEIWLSVPFISLGKISTGLSTPDTYCLVTYDNIPFFRIDLYEETQYAFEDAIIWRKWVVLGFGESMHFVALEDQKVHSYHLDSYFGHFYQASEVLVVATAYSLYCFNSSAEHVWYTPNLGIDGVVVKKIEKDIIYAEGEWNPPSDVWTPYQLFLQTGKKVGKK
jgi:hypothetical protein